MRGFSNNRGFTMIELVLGIVVISILSIAAYMATTSETGNTILKAATEKLIADIRYTHHLARTKNGWYGISFDTQNNTYSIYSTDGVTDTNVTNPAERSQTFVINIPVTFNGVTISSANIDGGAKVEFNPAGVPYTDAAANPIAANGSVQLSLGQGSNTIIITKTTGKVEVQ